MEQPAANPPQRRSPEDVAARNPAVVPERVREMQALMKRLHECGMLQPAKYGVQPALSGTGCVPGAVRAPKSAALFENLVLEESD